MYNEDMYNKKAVGLFAAAVATLIAAVGCAEPAQATTSLLEAINALPVSDEHRDSYQRDLFPHWSDDDGDRCDTRKEVLIDEAIQPVTVTASCSIREGTWWSYYDDVDVDNARKLDVDHMVPLAEAWDSGAWTWTTERRKAYANDIADGRSLVAVTAASNRSKADQDPGTWMPSSPDARCRYILEWTIVKTRWHLSVDELELAALKRLSAGCSESLPPLEVV